MISKTLKARLNGAEPLRGTFIKLNAPAGVEALGASGLDFVIIDGEHAPCDQLTLEHLIRAADCANLPVLVRVPTCDDSSILKVLDLGASGVQLPGLETVEAAQSAAAAVKYAPEGRRGLSFAQRSARYGAMDSEVYLRLSNENLVTVVHIENKEMVEQIEQLCAIEGIDVLFLGPMDLSQSYGCPGHPEAPAVQAAITRVIDTANRLKKPLGIFVGTVAAAEKYEALGVRYVVIGSDAAFLVAGARQAARQPG